MKNIFLKHKQLILYIIFGGLTTVINIVGYYLLSPLFAENLKVLATIIATVISIIFAYITSKIFVFESKDNSNKAFWVEMGSFFAARGLSLALDALVIWIMVDNLKYVGYLFSIFTIEVTQDLVIKIVLNVFIVFINYILSKFFIFKNKG